MAVLTSLMAAILNGVLQVVTISASANTFTGHYIPSFVNLNAPTIAVYAQTESVATETNFPVENTLELSQMMTDVGRSILGNFVWQDPPLGPYIDYYYKALPTNGKIQSIRPLRTDWDSITFVIHELEDVLDDYTQTETIDHTLSYIRELYAPYSNENWWHLAGDSNNARSDVANYYQTHDNGMDFHNFFGYFANAQSLTTHSGIRGKRYLDSTKTPAYSSDINFLGRYTVTDPSNSNKPFDFFHWIAALDAVYQNTDRNDLFVIGAFGTKENGKHIGSWGGDMQTLARQVTSAAFENKTPSATLFETFMDWNGSSFPEEDLLADLDAYNIAKNYLDKGTRLSNAMLLYYQSLIANPALRYDLFLDFLIESEGGLGLTDQTKISLVEAKIADLLNLKNKMAVRITPLIIVQRPVIYIS